MFQNVDMIMGDEDDITELIALIDELNQSKDLIVKLKSQAKIAKILSNYDDQQFFGSEGQSPDNKMGEAKDNEV